MKKRISIFLAALSVFAFIHAQDKAYARRLIDTLCSPTYHGRGYVNGGQEKAAFFLSEEMKRIGLNPKGDGFLQSFFIPVNTFPGPVELTVDGKRLEPGKDFLVAPGAPPIQGSFKIRNPRFKRHQDMDSLQLSSNPHTFNVIPPPLEGKRLQSYAEFYRKTNRYKGAGIVRLSDQKIYWSKSGSMPVRDYVLVDVMKDAWPRKARRMEIQITSVAVPRYEVHNVFGLIEGKRSKDTLILFTAHYDHLGMLGPTALFQGANDNASGVAMMFDLARYFKETPPGWSMGFLACGAEESGLHGSEYFAANPLIPLESIAFVINLDMVGTGGGGIRVVNGTTHPEAFEVMASINAADSLLSSVTAGGVSRNSDHYPFHKRGVPAFFIFTRGDEYREYHTLSDKPEDVPLTKYDEVFTLLRRFVETLMQP